MDKKLNKWGGFSLSRNTQASLSVAFFQFSQLLHAGVGIDYCLTEVVEIETSRELRRVWRDIETSVKAGESLSAAMARWPAVFSKTLVALVKSGESAGELAKVCAECQQLIDWQQNVKSRLSEALIYPVFAFAIVTAVISFLVIYLVPSLKGFLLASPTKIPWHTALLLDVSLWLKEYIFLFLLVLISLLVVLILGYQCLGSIRTRIDSFLMVCPYWGPLTVAVNLSRYCENCAKLYSAGVGLSMAMQISEGLVSNTALESEFCQARIQVISGRPLSQSLSDIHWIPRIIIRMVKAGESAGQLPKCLTKAGTQQKQIVDQQIGRLEKAIGPLVLLLVGSVMLWIVVSLLGPIYQSAIDAVVFS